MVFLISSDVLILQNWFDPNLKWNKDLYDNISFVELDPLDIWTPQINLRNRYATAIVFQKYSLLNFFPLIYIL